MQQCAVCGGGGGAGVRRGEGRGQVCAVGVSLPADRRVGSSGRSWTLEIRLQSTRLQLMRTNITSSGSPQN